MWCGRVGVCDEYSVCVVCVWCVYVHAYVVCGVV